MKGLSAIFSAFFLSFLLLSCSKSKDETTPPPYVVEGIYLGKIGSGIQTPTGHFSIKLKSGGLMDRINEVGSVTATGTWQLSGNTFTAHYESSSGVKVDLTGILNSAQKRIQGNWSSTNGNSGTYNVTKE